jgi:predicted metal-dependent phosphoesterase TrpH
MAIDLHLHSTASDGGDDPADLIESAAAMGLTTVALTDHDNLDGITEARRVASAHGIEFIPGSELSVEWPHGSMHLLVYFLEPGPGPLQDRLSMLQQGRKDRNHKVVATLNDLGVDITYEEISDEALGKGIGRPHIAAVMMRKGFVDTIQEAFDRYLATGRPAYMERVRLGYTEAIELARASGAVPVVAHPHTIGVAADDYGSAFETLADAGVMGIECYYSEYDGETREHLASLAAKLDLVATGGSDYHGRFKPGIAIGAGRGDLTVSPGVAEELLEARDSA